MNGMNTNIIKAGAATLCVGALLVATGAFSKPAPVCPAKPPLITLTAQESPSDLELAQRAAPVVAPQVAALAADRCAVLRTGLAGARPESDLALASKQLQPTSARAANRKPWIRRLARDANHWLRVKFLDPLKNAQAQPGSPVFTTFAAVAKQNQADGFGGGLLVHIGDGFAVERAPDGGMIDLRRLDDPHLARNLRSFLPLLRGLKGGCVVLVGAGGDSHLGLARQQNAEQAIRRALQAAGIGFVWTRSLDVPTGCPR